MNRKKTFRVPLRVNLTFLIVVEYIAITLLAFAFTALLQHFGISVMIPDIVSYLIMGLLLGSAVTFLIGAWIFAPITRLGNAMGLVAQGNFDVRLSEKHKFKEIEAIYKNFNLMAQELGTTEILQSDFVSNVSHEFKTPINAIEGYATLLQGEQDHLSDEQAQYIDKILLNTRRLSKLVGNILLLSKVDNQAIQSQKNTYRLDEQIRQSILLLEPEWAGKDIEFDIDLQIADYTGYESLIPEDAKKHIFDRFYQSDNSHRQEGNGLGLALVKQIVNISHGMVKTENLSEGGCRFTVILPLEA